jgi:hypothetical protein
MDEIAVLKTFRAEVPERDDDARAAVRRVLQQRRRRHRALLSGRNWILVGAVLVAVAAASSAFGWTSRLIDAVAGEPAPAPVKEAFAVMNEAGAREMIPSFRRVASDAIVERAHGAIGINSSLGPVIIWAAPTRRGGICWIVDIERLRGPDGVPPGSGGCNPTMPWLAAEPLHHVLAETRVGDGYLRLLHGRALRDVSSIELRYADGEAETLAVLNRFFLHELSHDSKPEVLIARDESGAEIGRRYINPTGMQPGPVGPEDSPAQIGPERVLIRLETSTGHPLTFSLAPAEGSQLCHIERYRGSLSGGCGRDRRERVGDAELIIGPGLWNEPPDGKPLVKLSGVVGSTIAELELLYVDGTRTRIPIVERFVLFEIPPAHHDDPGFTLIGRDRDGAEVARRVVGSPLR